MFSKDELLDNIDFNGLKNALVTNNVGSFFESEKDKADVNENTIDNNFDVVNYNISNLYFNENLRCFIKKEDFDLFVQFIEKSNELIKELEKCTSMDKNLKREKYKNIKEKVYNANSLDLILQYYTDFENEIYDIGENMKYYSYFSTGYLVPKIIKDNLNYTVSINIEDNSVYINESTPKKEELVKTSYINKSQKDIEYYLSKYASSYSIREDNVKKILKIAYY